MCQEAIMFDLEPLCPRCHGLGRLHSTQHPSHHAQYLPDETVASAEEDQALGKHAGYTKQDLCFAITNTYCGPCLGCTMSRTRGFTDE